MSSGKIVQIIGAVVDVEFPPDALPEINTALEFDVELDFSDDPQEQQAARVREQRLSQFGGLYGSDQGLKVI